MSFPSSNIVPELTETPPRAARSVVVLPAPDGPTIEKNSPSIIEKETPRKIGFDLKYSAQILLYESFVMLPIKTKLKSVAMQVKKKFT